MATEGLTRETALDKVAQALDRVRYGEIVVKVVNGRPEWVEVHEKMRVLETPCN